MTHTEWLDVIRPKVDGAKSLHHALDGHDLDFFFLASSQSSTLEHPGQANYAAANTFLEGFCRYRHSLGLPASVLNIGAIKGVGFLAENALAKRKVASQGLHFFSEREFLNFMEVSLMNSTPVLLGAVPSSQDSCHLIMGLDSSSQPDNTSHRPEWYNDRRLAIYDNMKAQTKVESSTASGDLSKFLGSITENPDVLADQSSAEFLAHEIGRKVLSFGFKPDAHIDTSLTLVQLGMDSLMAS